MANESVAASPAFAAASPGNTKIPAPIIVPIPIANPPTSPIVRSSSTSSWTVVSSVTAFGSVAGASPATFRPAGSTSARSSAIRTQLFQPADKTAGGRAPETAGPARPHFFQNAPVNITKTGMISSRPIHIRNTISSLLVAGKSR